MFCIICRWKTSRPLSFQSRVLLRKDRFLRGETTGLSSTSAAHSSKMVGAGSTLPPCWFPWLVLRRITGLQREQPLMCWWLPQSRGQTRFERRNVEYVKIRALQWLGCMGMNGWCLYCRILFWERKYSWLWITVAYNI